MPRKQKKYHYIYKTTNIVTKKFYVGMHSTNNLNDGYVGSGKLLWYSIHKYGKENHPCEILEYLPNRDLLREREKEIVNESLVADKMCMNLIVGGKGDWDNVDKNVDGRKEGRKKCDLILKEKYGDEWRTVLGKLGQQRRQGLYPNLSTEVANKGHDMGWFSFQGKKHSQNTKDKMSKAKKNKFCGGDNSNAKVVIDNHQNIFPSIRECAEYHDIHVDTVKRRINKNIYKLILDK